MNVKTKFKEKSLSVLEKQLDAIFSDFIRIRDSENGRVKCFVCGATMPWRQSQNGHYIPRAKMPTRYDEMNCHAVCESCNVYDKDHQQHYRTMMVVHYGLTRLDALELRSQSLQKFMRPELEDLISDFKAKVESIKKRKGL